MSESRRLVGLETEYGCLVEESMSVYQVIGRLRDWFFENRRFGLIDQHHRDFDEPPGNGGFLFNGGRVYEDMGHLEICTPECRRYSEVVQYDRAGDAMLEMALEELGLKGSVSFIRNNIDHHTGATFGCHENYSTRRDISVSEEAVYSLLAFLTLRSLYTQSGVWSVTWSSTLLAFLTLRSLYTGAGRVGGMAVQCPRVEERERNGLEGFQITQWADYVENDFFSWVQGNRAIINTRDEPLADPARFRRLHLLHGDTNVLPSATFFKVGTTALVLDLWESHGLPALRLRDPVATIKRLSYQPCGPWRVALASSVGEGDAVEILESFRETAERAFRGRGEETDAVFDLWEEVNAALLTGSGEGLVGLLDWCTKAELFQRFCQSEGLTMRDP